MTTTSAVTLATAHLFNVRRQAVFPARYGLRMHPTLRRLDDLAVSLARRGDVIAVLGLGSAGVETERFDEHSDIDFWLVVDDAAVKEDLLAGTDWLAGFGGRLAYSNVDDPNGRKALFEDGLFLEYAVFTPAELTRLAFTGARVAWQRPGQRPRPRRPRPAAGARGPAHDGLPRERGAHEPLRRACTASCGASG